MDTVADGLIRIKNGYAALRPEVILGYSNLVLAICKLLQKEGYIQSVEEVKDEKNKNIRNIKVALRYENKRGALTGLRRVSKPGLRVYKGSKMLPYVLNGSGIAIISTPKGVMSDRQARKEKLGGEIVAYVW